MAGFEEKDGTLRVDGLSFGDIARDVGTPTYVYSASVIKAQYDALSGALQRALPKDRQPLLCFACKANSNLAILSYLRSLGSALEVVSQGEMMRGIRAGFDPKKIVATGVGKQDDEIAYGLKNGILQFNVESLPELYRINDIASAIDIRADVAFRLNPNVAGGGHQKISTGQKFNKFGITEDMIDEAFASASSMSHVNPVGLSMHIGSQVSTVESFKTAFEKIPAIVGRLRAAGHTISRLDIGGGFPILYKDEKLLDLDAYARWVADIIAPLDTQIIMEPGRYLVGNAGVLLTKTIFVKETADRTFLIVDAAMNDLIRPTLYEAYHGIEPVENRHAPARPYDVVGPICETGDTFARDREIPAVKRDDLVVIRSAGAYGMCMASNYNTRGLPAEVLVKDGAYSVIHKRQDVESIIDQDIVPEWLQ
jgi:diaminopimelate decarboxylase